MYEGIPKIESIMLFKRDTLVRVLMFPIDYTNFDVFRHFKQTWRSASVADSLTGLTQVVEMSGLAMTV